VWKCQQRVQTGQLPDPEEYEAVPYLDQMMERLTFGRDYLRQILVGMEANQIRESTGN